jgi:hypothetical protein
VGRCVRLKCFADIPEIGERMSQGVIRHLDDVYQKNPDIVSRKIADEVILVPIRRNIGNLENIYTLNKISTFVWELIDGRRNVKEIVDAVRENFEVGPSTAINDVVDFLRELEDSRIAIKSGRPARE